MKKQILAGILALGTAVGAFAQGTITFDNGNQNASPTLGDLTHGSIYVGPATNAVLLNQDINLTFLAGPTAGSLTTQITLLLKDGSAAGDNTALGTAGQFLDTTGGVYTPGVAGGAVAFYNVEAWLGQDTSYAAALADGSPVGTSGIFSGATGGGGTPPGPPNSVGDYMPSFTVVGIVPEPTTLALLGLGASSLLLFRRKK